MSSWLSSWLPVNPNPGFITQTETWDYRNNDWANRYNHEVRAFTNNVWVVQREQGDYGDCGIIASIDCFEAKTGIYGGYTQTWLDTAIAHGWASGSSSDPANYGVSNTQGNAYLMTFMGQQLNAPVTATSGNKTFSQLLSDVSAGYKVLIGIDLSYVPEYNGSGGHAQVLLGSTTYNGVLYAEVTNGWSIQSNQNQYIAGFDPTSAYPITLIPFSELQSAYNAHGQWYAELR